MKKIERKIKNSIILPDISFYEKLPKIGKKYKYNYKLVLTSTIIIFLVSSFIINNNSEIVINKDNIIFNEINMNNQTLDKTNISEINYGYKIIGTKADDINKKYNIKINTKNLISSDYIFYDNEENTICYTSLDYNINNKNINVKISDSLEHWNIETYGYINYLYNSNKSIINNKEIILSKYNDHYYSLYNMYEYDTNIIYYHALYQKDNLYYYITANDLNEEDFIKFIKEYII